MLITLMQDNLIAGSVDRLIPVNFKLIREPALKITLPMSKVDGLLAPAIFVSHFSKQSTWAAVDNTTKKPCLKLFVYWDR